MLDARRLRLLRDLARLGTIAAVAEAHTYTPSAVSQQLSVLEREAGVALLERTGRRVSLTPAGAVLVKHAEIVLAALEQASAALAVTSTLTGPFRIGAFPTAVRTLLPAALVALGNEHAGLELMVHELDPVAVPDRLRERRLDVGLVHDYDVVPIAPDLALDGVSLLDETVFLAVPAADIPTGTDPVRGVRDAAWIVGSPGSLCHTVALRICRTAGFTAQVRHYADDFGTVLALVAAGQGVAVVPQLAAAQPLIGVHLIPLPTRRRTRIVFRRGAASHPAVAAFISVLRASTASYLSQ
jgi:DNA-binding transcriptional LysR family regulator